ncbi:MAG: hypothetical protein GXY76_08755 [Chloroflexi bacterium]|nr:hypothetical protein [Chloroflexota bacterium]
MATQTFPHSSFGDGIVRVEFDVNDANWRVSQVRCINDSPHPARARILRGAALLYDAIAPAGQTTSWNTSGVQLGWNTADEDGDGIMDGGLMMGDYVVHVQWPAGA